MCLVKKFLLFNLISAVSYSQSASWVTALGGVGSETILSLDADPAGNTYITGKMNGTAIFGNYSFSSQGLLDIFVAKVTTNDSVLWAKRFGGTNDDVGRVTCVINDRVFVTGTYWGTMIIGNDTLVSQGLEDIFLICMDTAGTVLWSKSYGGTNTEEPSDLKMDPNGNLLFSLYFLNYTVVDTFIFNVAGGVLVNMDLNGQIQWTKAYPHINMYELEYLSDGKLVMAGEFDGPVNFDTITMTSAGSSDMFVALLDTNRIAIWANQYGGNTTAMYDKIHDLAIDDQNNIYFAGQFRLTMNFGTQTLVGPGVTNAVVGKLTANGGPVWARNNGGNGDEVAYGITLKNDKLYFTGSFNGFLTWGSFSFVSGGGLDPYVGMMDTAGTFIWVISYGNSGADEYGVAFDFDQYGYCYFGGVMGPSALIDTFQVFGSGGDNVLLVKFSDVFLGIPEPKKNSQPLSIYPNPASYYLNFNWPGTAPQAKVASVYSSFGELILHFPLGNSNNRTIPFPSNLLSGLYLLDVKDVMGNSYVSRFCIIR